MTGLKPGLVLFVCSILLACDQKSAPPMAREQSATEPRERSFEIPPMPVPVANNSVALTGDRNHYRIYSFLGLLSGKTWSDVTDRAFEYDSLRQGWQEIDPVPGGQGRLAGTAQTVAGKVYVLGGYTVAEDGSEVSWPGVYQLDPQSKLYTELSPMPVPVDDTVSAVYQDRYIYLVSGWHDTDNVDNVQVYDSMTDQWRQATPYPGPALFGHAGGLVDNRLLVCDGVKVVPLAEPGKRAFVISDVCYLGVIDRDDGSRIEWRQVDAHPGVPLYRAAAAALNGLLVFAGGTDNPYNYDGIGYDSNPSAPLNGVQAFDPVNEAWISLPDLAKASMDHRGLMTLDGKALIAGGMNEAQQVIATVQIYAGLAEQQID